MILTFSKQNFVQINVICILILQAMVVCENIDAHVSLSVEGKGFHRSINYRVKFDNVIEGCYVAIYLGLPSGLYVNIDELINLRRLEASSACSNGETDIELFSEKAGIQNVTICSPLTDTQCIVKLPIHQRYRYASKVDRYVNITLPKPKLLLGCKKRIKEYRISKIDLCSPCVEIVPKWREIPYVMDTEDVWAIPVGDTAMLPLVTYVTFLLTILCTIFLMQTIWKSLPKKHRKRE